MGWLCLVGLVLLAGLLPACTPLATPTPTQMPAASTSLGITPSPVPETTPTTQIVSTLQAGVPGEAALDEAANENELLPRTQYTLTANLTYDLHQLSVSEEILYYNHSTRSLTELRLMVEPHQYPGVFEMNVLTWGTGVTSDFIWEGHQLKLPLELPLAPGDGIKVFIAYDLYLPSPQPSAEVRPVPFGYTQRQTNLVDWYPFIPPYEDDTGWIAHPPGFFGEHQVYELADFNVRIKINDPRPEFIIAASSQPTAIDESMHYSHVAARSFAWSISPNYQMESIAVGATTVTSYFFDIHTQAGRAVLETTAQAMELYNRLFGIYPRDSLAVVEADFLDGMEYDGLYFLSNGFYNLYQGTPGEYLITIAAHETAHQWFYGIVGNDQALEPWLDEALCTYTEHIYYETFAPEALDWWWSYRVVYYDPRGWVDGSIYNPEGYRAYRDAIYLNGATFLNELRSLIGDDAFFPFLKTYVETNQGKIATTDDFFAALEKHTSVELNPLVSSYFLQR